MALIPQLFKTILLLESNEARTEIMNCSIVRRALFCKACVGPWLTSMIRCSSESDLAIDFIKAVSELSVEDYVGSWRNPTDKDINLYKESKIGVYQATETLMDIIPSLLVLSTDLLDRAVSMPLLWSIMNHTITNPFTVGVTITDFQLQLTLLIAVRDVSFNAFNSNLDWFGAKYVISFIAVYQIARKCAAFCVLHNISPSVARRHIMNFWSLLDLLGILGALLAAMLLTNNPEQGGYKQ